MKEALLYEQLDNDRVQCHLCAHRCVIAPGRKGICLVRENREGSLYTLVYGIPLARAVDPIEKKPLFHFYPGSSSYSIATAGCNFRCHFCQNADISQMPRLRGQILGRQASPQEIVRSAERSGSRSIAYTYTEPTIFFEYSYDIARLAHARGIASVYISNGYMTREMLEMFQGIVVGQNPQPPGAVGQHEPLLGAANVDLKAFQDETYHQVCSARLQPVLDTLKTMKELGIWLEVTTLVVPTLNDSPSELRDIAQFIAHELGTETPWHVSRFHPDFDMRDLDPTPAATMRRAYEEGKNAGLHYVYVGNLPSVGLEDTYCPVCGKLVIGRRGFSITKVHLQEGRCAYCQAAIHGVGMQPS